MKPIQHTILGLCALSSALAAQPAAPADPNILVLPTDDVGWGDFRCCKAREKIPSPDVDRMAREGMCFTDGHAPGALCAMARHAMLMGNHPWRGRGPGGTWGFDVPASFREGRKMVANLLQEAGHRTAMFGKSGVGGKPAEEDGEPDFKQAEGMAATRATSGAIRASKNGSRWISHAGRTPVKQCAAVAPGKGRRDQDKTGPGAGSAPAAAGEAHFYKKVGDRELKLFVVKPPEWKARDQRPAMVFFHGGGWVGGGPAQFNDQAAYLATRGMVCVQVEYRLLDKSNTEPPLVCVQDAKSAMRWVRAHATELGIDPGRIGAGGGSAGGHLAAFTGLVDGQDDPQDDLSVSPKASALVLFNPVFDNGSKGGWGQNRVGDRIREFSPAHNISADDPPAIVLLGREDNLIPVTTVERFQSNMKAVGVRCDATFYDRQGHGFFNHEPFKTRTLVEADKFLASLGWLTGPPTLKEPDTASNPPPVAGKRKRATAGPSKP